MAQKPSDIDILPRRSTGTLTTRRKQLSWPEDKVFRILSIDGGGIRGVFPAKVLASLESTYLNGNCIGDYFDLIAGTSTGGIIALGLSVGVSAAQILDLYITNGRQIFPDPSWPLSLFKDKNWFHSVVAMKRHRYDADFLSSCLRDQFGEKLIGDAIRRLCIPCFDQYTEVNILKTPHHPDFQKDWRDSLVTAALKTSAAPTYFSSHESENRRYLDGGVWANNPTMIALVEVLASYEIDRRNIWIVSIGCAENSYKITQKMLVQSGVWHWKNILSGASRLQSENALGQAGLLIGRDHLLRIETEKFLDNPIALDDYDRSVQDLLPEAELLAQNVGPKINEIFLADKSEPYRAFHGPRANRES